MLNKWMNIRKNNISNEKEIQKETEERLKKAD